MVNPNVLSQRYATDEINNIFSEEGKIFLERDLWLVVLKAQRELGLEIPESAITAYENAKSDINLKTIKEIEMRNKHDIKAKIEAYNPDICINRHSRWRHILYDLLKRRMGI